MRYACERGAELFLVGVKREGTKKELVQIFRLKSEDNGTELDDLVEAQEKRRVTVAIRFFFSFLRIDHSAVQGLKAKESRKSGALAK